MRRKYLEYFVTLDSDDPAAAFDPTATPTTPYGSQRYDAFGRQVQTYDLDGTVTLESVYHALCTDLYDAADLEAGPHQGTFASTCADGHGRTIQTTERLHVGTGIEARQVETVYLPTGEPTVITRRRGTDTVTRWMQYDSLGRMVLNVEPNTSQGYVGPGEDASTTDAWRYLYNVAGDLVGTEDARHCGINFTYDGAGRLLAEDYWPCEPWHPAYTDGFASLENNEVLYHYDTLPGADSPSTPEWQRAPQAWLDQTDATRAAFFQGRLTATYDRASASFSNFDGRGRVLRVATRVAKPSAHIARAGGPGVTGFDDRYATGWYERAFEHDAADRDRRATTGATVPDLLNNGESAVETEYSSRGTVSKVTSSYGELVASLTRTADGLLTRTVYGDAAGTTTENGFDTRRRLRHVMTYRGPPGIWDNLNASADETHQLLLQDEDITYDVVGNPTEIRDWRLPEEWPAGAKPVTRNIAYDDLYRVARVDYEYSEGADSWQSPHQADLSPSGPSDPRRARPSPHQSFAQRVQWQTYEYDWLGNTSNTGDDAGGFYDRSLGEITNSQEKPYQLTGAELQGGEHAGALSGVTYDAAGNMTGFALARSGPCLPTGANCNQAFSYQWDEAGRLVRATRHDGGTQAADLHYLYDTGDQRVLKTAVDAGGQESHTVYALETLELRRATYTDDAGYERTPVTEVPYLLANGVRLARVVHHAPNQSLPEVVDDGIAAGIHVLLELGDHLGSTNVVLDLGTGELVERSTFYAYGATESDYRPDRWGNFREDYRFTGKEEDVEVGLTYFGKRYLNAYLGRWVSADPLGVHGLGADLNGYAYVSGAVLKAVDPVGLKVRIHDSFAKNNNGQAAGPERRQEVLDAIDSITDDKIGYKEVKGPNNRTIWELRVESRAKCEGRKCSAGTELVRTAIESDIMVLFQRRAMSGSNPGDFAVNIAIEERGGRYSQVLVGTTIAIDTEKLVNHRIDLLTEALGGGTQWTRHTLQRTLVHELCHAYRALVNARIWFDKQYGSVDEPASLPTGESVVAKTKREEVETTGNVSWARKTKNTRVITENIVAKELGMPRRVAYSVDRIDGRVRVDGATWEGEKKERQRRKRK